jgi:hypothetical protein
MIVERHVSEREGMLPVPMELFEILHNISMFLIRDDAGDVGYFRYSDRDHHYHHGKLSPDHPSVVHHWQIGVGLLFLSQVGSLMNLGMGVYEDYKKAESGDVSGIDQDILDLVDADNSSSITLDEYKEEVDSIPQVDLTKENDFPALPPMPDLPGLSTFL